MHFGNVETHGLGFFFKVITFFSGHSTIKTKDKEEFL